jgi:hypothetical protein
MATRRDRRGEGVRSAAGADMLQPGSSPLRTKRRCGRSARRAERTAKGQCTGNVRDGPSATVRDEPPAHSREPDFAHGCAPSRTVRTPPRPHGIQEVEGSTPFGELSIAGLRQTPPLRCPYVNGWTVARHETIAMLLASAFSSVREFEGLQQPACSRVGVDRGVTAQASARFAALASAVDRAASRRLRDAGAGPP